MFHILVVGDCNRPSPAYRAPMSMISKDKCSWSPETLPKLDQNDCNLQFHRN